MQSTRAIQEIAFKEMIYAQRSTETEKEMKHREREVGQDQKRITELDRVFKRIYKDGTALVIGSIPPNLILLPF